MKKVFKFLGIIFVILLLVVIGAATYVKTALPNVGPPPDLKVEITPERVERGEYLANHVMLCMDCHGERDFSLFAAPPKPGSQGSGGEIFDQKFGFPGTFVAVNLTPFGIGDWTDGELYRAITCGVSKDGHALFPVMPYKNFGKMADEDIHSVIAYLRTLSPIENSLPTREIDFPVNFIINTMPIKGVPEAIPSKSDPVAYGKYMINAAGCAECHTKHEKGEVVGKYLAGGFVFPMPDGSVVRSANITQHPTKGIGSWTEETFMKRFKQYVTDSTKAVIPVEPGQMQTIMPWYMYAGMDSLDLKSIFAYLKTVEPVDESVITFEPKKN